MNYEYNEQVWRDRLDCVPDWIWETDPQGTFTYTNSVVTKLLGYLIDEVVGRTVFSFLVPEDVSEYRTAFESAGKTGRQIESMRYQVKAKSGQTLVLEFSFIPIIEKSRLAGFRGISRKVLERDRSSGVLEDSRNRLKKQKAALVELSTSHTMRECHFEGCLQQILEVAARTTDVERVSYWSINDTGDKVVCEDLYELSRNLHSGGESILVADYPDYFDHILQQRVVAHDAQSDQATAGLAKDYLIPLGISSMMDAPVRAGGRTVGIACFEHVGLMRYWEADEETFAGSIADLIALAIEGHERKQAEEALRTNEHFLQIIFNGIQDGISIHDVNFNILRVNKAMEEWYSYAMPICGKKCYEIYQGRGEECERCPAIRAVQLDVPQTEVVPYLDKDGAQKGWLELYAYPIHDDQGNVWGTIEQVRDVTDRVHADNALRESEATLRSVFRAAPIGIGITKKRVISYVNAELCEMTGYDSHDMIGQSSRMLYENREEFERVGRVKYAQIQEQGTGTVETRWLCKDGGIIDILLSSSAIDPENLQAGVVFTATDVTQLKRAEEERIAYEKHLDEQKRSFYRDTILSVTEGKLDICEDACVTEYITQAQMKIDVNIASEVADARHAVEAFCRERGLVDDQLDLFMLGVGEAITNAIKHAREACVYAGTENGSVWVAVSDKGSGIGSLVLPKAILRRGFSTKPSLGIGYSIMLDVSDSIYLSTGREGTTVVLVKLISANPSEPSLFGLPDTWN